MARRKSGKWFIKVRGSYLPNNVAGWLTYIPYVAYLIWVAVFVLQRYDSFAEIALLTIPNWVAAAVAMHWIATATS